MSEELDALFTDKPTRNYGICAICGKPRTVQIQTKISRVNGNGPIKGQTTSVTAVLCDEHGLAAFNTSRTALGR